MSEGNPNVMRLRARHPHVRDAHAQHSFDVNAIPVLHRLTHLPVVRRPEPRHGTTPAT